MNRILGTVVAIAGVLAFSSLANAAPYSFDISGTGTATTRSDAYSPTPCGLGFQGNCFINPLSAGSSINLDITGGYASITSGTLEIDAVTSIVFGTIVLTADVTATISGGLGTLTGNDIVWTQPALYSTTGTLMCNGPNCSVLAMDEGVLYPIAILNAIGNTSSVNPLILGTWQLDAGLTTILGSTRTVTSLSNIDGSATGWLNFGANDLGKTVPEPGSAALVLLGLGALALRSRKA